MGAKEQRPERLTRRASWTQKLERGKYTSEARGDGRRPAQTKASSSSSSTTRPRRGTAAAATRARLFATFSRGLLHLDALAGFEDDHGRAHAHQASWRTVSSSPARRRCSAGTTMRRGGIDRSAGGSGEPGRGVLATRRRPARAPAARSYAPGASARRRSPRSSRRRGAAAGRRSSLFQLKLARHEAWPGRRWRLACAGTHVSLLRFASGRASEDVSSGQPVSTTPPAMRSPCASAGGEPLGGGKARGCGGRVEADQRGAGAARKARLTMTMMPPPRNTGLPFHVASAQVSAANANQHIARCQQAIAEVSLR